MSKKIFGTIRDTAAGGRPVRGLRVQAWDDDYPDADDFMGEAITDANGNYEIRYSDGHWDPSISPRATTWRPDIYITVAIKNAGDQWVLMKKSSVHSDHKLEDDLQIDLDVEIEQPMVKTPTFQPQKHGFHFVNSFTISPDILGVDLGSWNMGLCGGMCAAALNRFRNNTDIPDTTEIPVQGTALYDELLRRQIRTLFNILDDIYDWQSAPDEEHWHRKRSVGARTKKEWWKLKNELDNDTPAILVLIREEGYLANPTLNHQVLAIGYEYDPTTKDLQIQVYDPNYPDETNTLSMSLGLPNSQLNASASTGERVRGFFVNPNGDTASA
jgi:hypothetical protein